jgi:hypothetical protein
MKNALVVTLADDELLDLFRILLDRDEAGALAFLDRHLKAKAKTVLEGG